MFEKSSQFNIRVNESDEVPVNDVGVAETSVTEICAILDFLLDIIFGRGNEYLPTLFKRIVAVLSKRCENFTVDELQRSLSVVAKIW